MSAKKKVKSFYVGGRLFVGMMSGRVYWAPRVRFTPLAVDSKTGWFNVVGDKKDVTEMFEACARELGWTPPTTKTVDD